MKPWPHFLRQKGAAVKSRQRHGPLLPTNVLRGVITLTGSPSGTHSLPQPAAGCPCPLAPTRDHSQSSRTMHISRTHISYSALQGTQKTLEDGPRVSFLPSKLASTDPQCTSRESAVHRSPWRRVLEVTDSRYEGAVPAGLEKALMRCSSASLRQLFATKEPWNVHSSFFSHTHTG